jgi:hypothetical protein
MPFIASSKFPSAAILLLPLVGQVAVQGRPADPHRLSNCRHWLAVVAHAPSKCGLSASSALGLPMGVAVLLLTVFRSPVWCFPGAGPGAGAGAGACEREREEVWGYDLAASLTDGT